VIRNAHRIAAAAGLLGLAACNPFSRDLAIYDLSKPSVHELTTDADAKVVGIEMDIDGLLAGTVKLELLETQDGKTSVQREALLADGGEIHWSGDWYSPSAQLRVTPLTRSKGRIRVHYTFRTG
jgi:hypothetical protein